MAPKTKRVCRAAGAAALLALTIAAPTASAALPGTAYEMVSPPEKGGGPVARANTALTLPDGNGVSFVSTTAFGGAGGGLQANVYVAHRGPDGWTSTGLTPPQLIESGNNWRNIATKGLSEDLSTAMALSNRALAPGAVEGPENYYVQDVQSGAFTHLGVISSVSGNSFALAPYPFAGATPSGDHMLFVSETALTPDAIDGSRNLYLFSDGQLELVNRRADGTADPLLAVTGGQAAGGGSLGQGFNVISDDGERIFYGGAGSQPLYVRDGDETRAISVSRRPGDPTTPVNAFFGGASQDGSIVYFSSTTELTTDAPDANARSLYRYDVDTDELTYVPMDDGPFPSLAARDVVGISDDGSYVYFNAGDTSIVLPRNLWVHHEGETKLVFRADSTTQVANIGKTTVSADGTKVAFVTWVPDLAGSPTTTEGDGCPIGSGSCSMVYVYDATAPADPLSCASCPPSGANPSADASFDQTPDGGQGQLRRRALLDDGRVFFETPEPLLAEDVNSSLDVYQWHDGALALVSPGTPGHESRMASATPDGDSVFFYTDAPIVGQDHDTMFDLYVARVGGGIPAQNPPPPAAPCSGDGCRDSVDAPPTRRSPSSGGGDGEQPAALPRPTAGLAAIPARARRALAAGRRATFAVRVNRPGRIVLTARARVGGKRILAARTVRRAERAGTVRVPIRLRKPIRQRLARGQRVRLTLQVRFAGALDRPTKAVTLDRKGR